MTQEALKLALEALEEYVNVVVSVNDPYEWTPKVADAGEPAREAITAIKEALAQHDSVQAKPEPEPEQEPVAWLSTDSIGERHLCFDKPLDNDPVQPLFTTQPQRTWVGLTDLQKQAIKFAHSKMGMMMINYDLDAMLEATEQALKEKNT